MNEMINKLVRSGIAINFWPDHGRGCSVWAINEKLNAARVGNVEAILFCKTIEECYEKALEKGWIK